MTELRNKLLDATKPGGVAEWVQRIATLAETAGLPLSSISWSGSPVTVAHSVVDAAKRHGRAARLEALVDELLPKQQPTEPVLFYPSTPCSG